MPCLRTPTRHQTLRTTRTEDGKENASPQVPPAENNAESRKGSAEIENATSPAAGRTNVRSGEKREGTVMTFTLTPQRKSPCEIKQFTAVGYVAQAPTRSTGTEPRNRALRCQIKQTSGFVHKKAVGVKPARGKSTEAPATTSFKTKTHPVKVLAASASAARRSARRQAMRRAGDTEGADGAAITNKSIAPVTEDPQATRPVSDRAMPQKAAKEAVAEEDQGGYCG